MTATNAIIAAAGAADALEDFNRRVDNSQQTQQSILASFIKNFRDMKGELDWTDPATIIALADAIDRLKYYTTIIIPATTILGTITDSYKAITPDATGSFDAAFFMFDGDITQNASNYADFKLRIDAINIDFCVTDAFTVTQGEIRGVAADFPYPITSPNNPRISILKAGLGVVTPAGILVLVTTK